MSLGSLRAAGWRQRHFSDGERRPIEASFEIREGAQVGFQVADYDPTQPLVIDPELEYSTYLGGNAIDQGQDIAVDAAGQAHVTGWTTSADFPVSTNPYQTDQDLTDAFVTKLDATGTNLVYSTYLGGDQDDFGFGIAVDSDGNAYLTGETTSDDFPVKDAYQSTAAETTLLWPRCAITIIGISSTWATLRIIP